MNIRSIILNIGFAHMIFLFALLLQGISSTAQPYEPVTLEKIHQERMFYPKTLNDIRSMADGKHYTVLESNSIIVRYDYETGKSKTILFACNQLPGSGSNEISGYAFSTDENKLMLTTRVSSIYRHSFEAQYWIFDRITGKINALADSGNLQLASFSPDGLKVAFVRNNNLFIKDLLNHSLIQVTTDGLLNHIINGAPDWVYEEEFSFNQAYCWSLDSKSLAFYRFDESRVKQFDMTLYNNLYPTVTRFKYPKAGEDNSVVTIHVYHLETGKTMTMQTGADTDHYIPRIKWSAAPGELCIVRLNRRQNKVEVLLTNANTGVSRIIYAEENDRYISRIDDDYIHFLKNQKHFLILSERSGYYHYYLHDLNGSFINPITQGNWEATGIIGIDEESSTLYYSSNQRAVIQTDVYAVKFDGTHVRRLTEIPGTHEVEFSSTFKYFIDAWSDANTPYRYSLHRINGNLLRVLEDNAGLRETMKKHGFSKKEFIHIPVSDDLVLNAYIIKPFDFDSTRKYPLFISVYGGPESQDVVDAWDHGLAWQQLLTQQGIVVACIDNRGTDGRGEVFRKSTYMQLGKLETEDQVNAARFLGSKSWIDEERIGIWGWSYGGFMTLLCLTRGADVFSLGVAVAPVTNWRFYDNIYTERFMRKPSENQQGYDENSPIHHAGKLKGKLLLVHGTADDNVHVQNTIEMTERLVQENIQFEQFLYPNKNHGIYGGNTRFHLYSMMTEFIKKNL